MSAAPEAAPPTAPVSPARGESPARILFVVDGFYPATGGAEKQVRTLARAFAAAGHTVEVVAPQLDAKLPTADAVDGLTLTRLAYPHIKAVGALILCARYGLWVWRRRDDFDAIHINMAKNLAAVSGLLRPFLPSTVTVKISGAWEFDGGLLDPKLRSRPAQRFYNWCVRRVDNIQCVSEYTRQSLRAAGYPEASLLMIPNAVDLTRFTPRARKPDGVVNVAYVGRIRPVKGVSVLVDAWPKVAAQGNNARLLIAGDGAERGALAETARASGVGDTVEFLGEVTDVPGVLARADIYVQPSFQEGLPNAVLEAMAMGLPIVATRVSGNEDVVADGDNGLLVPPGDPEVLAAALRRLVADPALAARMGRRSREIVEARFSLAAVMNQLRDAYRKAPRSEAASGIQPAGG
jgi:glycosyltransferase involved in cell wall biosynthesis